MFFKFIVMKKIILFFIFLFSFFNVLNAQFTQRFDTGISTPSGWNTVNGGDVNGWEFGPPENGTAVSGANVAKIRYSPNLPHDDYLITPQIQVQAGINDRITFRVRNRSASLLEHFEVLLSTTVAFPTTGFTTTLLPDTAPPSTWTIMVIDLTPYIGQSVFVGFHAVSLNKYELYLDNVVNDTAPVCNIAAPVISSIIQPTCSSSGSATLSGLPTVGSWALYATSDSLGASNPPVTTLTSGTGNSATVVVANESYYNRTYSYYYTDDNGCQSPVSQIFIYKKYDFQPWIEGTYQDSNSDGIINIGDQIVYHILLHNFGNCDIGNSNITVGTDPGFTQFASLGTLNFPGNSTHSQDVIYNISANDISNGYVHCGLQINPSDVGYNFSNLILYTTTTLNNLSNEDFVFSGLNYFPNPVKNTLFISNSSVITQIEITSVLGKKMISLYNNDFQTEINLSNLRSGIYFVKVRADNKEKVFRILKV